MAGVDMEETSLGGDGFSIAQVGGVVKRGGTEKPRRGKPQRGNVLKTL
jgi:hypothetical protein